MPFPKNIREEALVKAHRHCCVCHEFAGRSVNVHHIEQEADGGSNTLENAIVLCLRCHTEAGHFNPRHPMGTKYSPSELKGHRDAWFKACELGQISFSSNVEVTSKRIYTSSDLHKYALLFNFYNGNKQVVSGWKLDVFIPHRFEVVTEEVEQHLDVHLDDLHYNKFQITGRESIYLGESHELTNLEWAKIQYSIDNTIFSLAKREKMKIIWKFYSNAEPPIFGEISWEDLQQF